jgi:hypothetical protein
MLGDWYVDFVERQDARRLANALRDQLWSTAMTYCIGSPIAAGMSVGLNPPEDAEDEELVEMVWRALVAAGLGDDE